MKGWKTQMENNTSYGRKMVRKSPYKKNTKTRNFMIYSVIVLLIGVLLGCLIWGLTHREKNEPASNRQEMMENVMQFGSYDDRVFEQEVSRDWASGDLNFVPLDCAMDYETQEFVFYLSAGYNIDWTLVMALIQKESSFRPDVISGSNDYGLMQINKINHELLTDTLGVTDYLDSEQNIRAGMFVLRKLFEEYKEPELVLMCYNMGETGASRLWAKGIYSTNYTEDILEIQKGFKEQLSGKEGTN